MKKMRIKHIVFSGLFVWLLIMIMVTAGANAGAEAASAKKKACQAYKRLLSEGIYYEGFSGDDGYLAYLSPDGMSFAVAYIDNNSVPELLVKPRDLDRNPLGALEADILVYTYYKSVPVGLEFACGSIGIADNPRPGYYRIL